MNHFKDLEACIAALQAVQAVQARSDIGPKQKKNVETAIEEAKRLRRRHDAGHSVTYRCVRRITESLINAFLNI